MPTMEGPYIYVGDLRVCQAPPVSAAQPSNPFQENEKWPNPTPGTAWSQQV